MNTNPYFVIITLIKDNGEKVEINLKDVKDFSE
jgi:hypothetical protein